MVPKRVILDLKGLVLNFATVCLGFVRLRSLALALTTDHTIYSTSKNKFLHDTEQSNLRRILSQVCPFTCFLIKLWSSSSRVKIRRQTLVGIFWRDKLTGALWFFVSCVRYDEIRTDGRWWCGGYKHENECSNEADVREDFWKFEEFTWAKQS